MEMYQTFNKKTKAWVKYQKSSGGRCKIVNVKQQNPTKPFKGINKK